MSTLRYRQKLPREIFAAAGLRFGLASSSHCMQRATSKRWPSGKKSAYGRLEEVKCRCSERLDVSVAEKDEALQVGSVAGDK